MGTNKEVNKVCEMRKIDWVIFDGYVRLRSEDLICHSRFL